MARRGAAGFLRLLRQRIVVPSGGFDRFPTPRRIRLLAVTAVRDERHHLPGLLANLAPQVDGIVALDDGSSDGSAQLLESHPAVLEVRRNPRDRPRWDEAGNHRALVAAALRHRAEWILAIDADERVEHGFRTRAERVIRRGRLFGFSVYSVRLRELWGDRDHFRVDGLWGQKRRARLFRARTDHRFDSRPLHGTKAPLQGRIAGVFPAADLELYHLRMIRPEDREARRDRYRRLDPHARWQPDLGYDYLTDESGLRLRKIPPARRFED